mgnify:FL=1
MDSLLVVAIILALCIPLDALVLWPLLRAFLRHMPVSGHPLEAVMSNLKFQQEEASKTAAARRAMTKSADKVLS